jgi:hypothetical protein
VQIGVERLVEYGLHLMWAGGLGSGRLQVVSHTEHRHVPGVLVLEGEQRDGPSLDLLGWATAGLTHHDDSLSFLAVVGERERHVAAGDDNLTMREVLDPASPLGHRVSEFVLLVARRTVMAAMATPPDSENGVEAISGTRFGRASSPDSSLPLR